MQIYLDYNEIIFKKCIDQITEYCNNTAQNGRFKINITNKVNLKKITNEIEKRKTFSKIRYFIPIEYLDVSYVKKTCNCKIIIQYQIKIDHELTKSDLVKLSKLSKLNRVFEVYDLSGINQSEAFITYRNFVYIDSKDKKDDIKFFYIVCDNRLDSCMYSSCLGKTIYVDNSGNYCFCPKYADKTRFSNIEVGLNNELLYNSESFLLTLSSAVKQRKSCYQNCNMLEICQGGCPMESSSCERFKTKYNLSKEFKKSLFDRKAVLNYELLYIEENMLWCVSRGKK